MSNTILISIGKTTDYKPFRWIANQLQAYVNGKWVNVQKTAKKNRYGDAVFLVSKIGEV